MAETQIIVICLPAATPCDQLESAAKNAYAKATSQAATAIAFGHFLSGAIWGKKQLLQPRKRTAAGGPVRMLDLTSMETRNLRVHQERFKIWHQVVRDTKEAKPYWFFLARHKADPTKYTLLQAKQDYRAQARVAAMETYNLSPRKIMELPTRHLEWLQYGFHTYAQLGQLNAVPGNAMVDLTGRYLKPATETAAQVRDFLTDARQVLTSLSPNDKLVALATL